MRPPSFSIRVWCAARDVVRCARRPVAPRAAREPAATQRPKLESTAAPGDAGPESPLRERALVRRLTSRERAGVGPRSAPRNWTLRVRLGRSDKQSCQPRAARQARGGSARTTAVREPEPALARRRRDALPQATTINRCSPSTVPTDALRASDRSRGRVERRRAALFRSTRGTRVHGTPPAAAREARGRARRSHAQAERPSGERCTSRPTGAWQT